MVAKMWYARKTYATNTINENDGQREKSNQEQRDSIKI